MFEIPRCDQDVNSARSLDLRRVWAVEPLGADVDIILVAEMGNGLLFP
jgi:hypothetical protein